jgi:hypothetical protein
VRAVKREVLLAIAVGAVAGLVGALTAPARPAAAVEATSGPSVAAPVDGTLEDLDAPAHARAAAQNRDAPVVLTVMLTPARELEVRLSRWSTASREWAALPPAQTDAQGIARLELKPGTYWLSAGSAARVVDFDVSTEVELKLESGLKVTGRVLEAGTRRPLSGVNVWARPDRSGLRAPESQTASVQSDSFGRFTFEDVPKGTVHVEASARGFRLNELDVPAVEGADPFDLFLEPACQASGRVVDERGGVAGASVSELSDERPVLSDAQGAFTLEVDCSRAQLVARDAAGRFATAKAGTGVTLTLGRGDLLHGVVRTKAGEPLAGADVTAASGDDQPRAHTTTDAQGLFAVGPVGPGSYIVHARKGRGMQGAVYGVDVPSSADVELTVDDAAALTGRVRDGNGEPAEGAEVKVSYVALRNERPAVTRTDANGEFRVDDLPIGAVTVTASDRDNRGSGDVRAYLSASAAANVTLTLQQHGRIVGTVTGPTHAGAQVTAFAAGEGQTSRRTIAAADGTFTLDVPAGEYLISARSVRLVHSALRFDTPLKVVAGQDTHVELELTADGGEGWGEMASVARGEVGASFENISGSVQLSWLVTDSPASRAGLQVGDLVTAIDGEPVRDALDTFARTRGQPGGNINITYRRDGSERTVAVTLAR